MRRREVCSQARAGKLKKRALAAQAMAEQAAEIYKAKTKTKTKTETETETKTRTKN